MHLFLTVGASECLVEKIGRMASLQAMLFFSIWAKDSILHKGNGCHPMLSELVLAKKIFAHTYNLMRWEGKRRSYIKKKVESRKIRCAMPCALCKKTV